MKTISRFFLLLATVLIFFAFSSVVFSQKITTWKGGTPGMETEWECPKNWSVHAVPDGFSDVIIPDVSTTTFAAPVITLSRAEVNSIRFTSRTLLTIKEGAQLLVYENCEELNLGNFQVEGMLFLIGENRGANQSAALNRL